MIYCAEDWLEVEENSLCDAFLMEIFVKDIHKTVYVSEGGIIKGIISHGDFCRYVIDNEPLIKRIFTSCTVSNENDAEKILREKANIYGIPVLDGEGRILREWRKEVQEDEGFSNCTLFGLYEQFLSDRDEYLNIMVMDLSVGKDVENAKNINAKADGKLLIIDKRDILNINKYFKGKKPGVVYDSIQKYANFNNIVYKRLKLKAEFLKKLNATEENMNHALEFYATVGILSSEAGELPAGYIDKEPVCILEDDKFVWNESENCFEYYGYIEGDKIPEVLWVSCCIIKNPCIIYRGKMIPVGSKVYSIYEKYLMDCYIYDLASRKMSDYDIAYNIIPKLKENKIKYIILSNIDDECGELKEFDINEAERRAIADIEGCADTRPASYFNLSAVAPAEEILSELRGSAMGWYKRGYKEFRDYKGKYMNISQGERLVVGNPVSYNHTLWLFGSCLIRGAQVDDASNIGSVLRKRIDNNYYIKNMGSLHETQNLCLRDAVLSEGDIVIIQAYDNAIYEKAGLKVYSLVDVYNNCPNLMEHITEAPNHTDAYVIEKIAERVYEILVNGRMLKICDEEKKAVGTFRDVKQIRMRKERDSLDVPQGLRDWLSGLQSYKGEPFSRTGAIVMNCNPFTLGHRYLIEQVCGQVDKLLIFVVEEDKSFFKFRDRLEMVRIGTKDLDKVSVIPSGRYIISSETLPGYFEKDDNPEIILDATDDLDLFAKVIAKELNISVRFVGEEPIDGFTRQYNQEMSKILPKNYIEFVEIPRKEQSGSVISASRVRELMKKRDYAGIKELVMPQIYEYLVKHYFGTSNYEFVERT